MDKKTCKLLGKYNENANKLMNEIINSLTEEEWNKEFVGYYKSIHELCSHIFGGDHRWLLRFKTIRQFNTLSEKRFNIEYEFEKLFFCDINEYIKDRKEMDKIIIDFVNELFEKDLETNIEWKNSKGIKCICTLGTGLLHLSNHETHHRGMISLYLENLGKMNDFSNLYPYEKML